MPRVPTLNSSSSIFLKQIFSHAESLQTAYLNVYNKVCVALVRYDSANFLQAPYPRQDTINRDGDLTKLPYNSAAVHVFINGTDILSAKVESIISLLLACDPLILLSSMVPWITLLARSNPRRMTIILASNKFRPRITNFSANQMKTDCRQPI